MRTNKRYFYMILLLSIIALGLILMRPQMTQADESIYFYQGDQPVIIQMSQDGSILYAAINGGIAVINKSTMIKVDNIAFPYQFWDMELDPSGEYIYCTYATGGNGTGRISRIRLSDKYIETIDLAPANASELTFDDDGDFAYVCGDTWPPIGIGDDMANWRYNLDSGRIFEIRTSDFTLTRSVNVGIGNHGISYQNGKLVIISYEEMGRQNVVNPSEWEISGFACHIVNATTLEVEYTIGVPDGFYNTSFALPGGIYVMVGSNSTGEDGVGFAQINVNTGEVYHWYVTEQDPFGNPHPEGGGWMMAVDEENNILYSTLYCTKSDGQSQYRFGVIDLNTNEYSDWYVAPFRVYTSIVFDPTSGKLYVAAPNDNAIVVLEPPE